MLKTDYQIGVYYFPGYHFDPQVTQWHGREWTEWDLLKEARPRFPNHNQPRIPLWGYEDEADPAVMKRKADTASLHGINHFIFDWYLYEGKPFLNRCLDEGFLKIAGGPPIKFALMWANHDWVDIQPASLDQEQKVLLPGTVDREGFRRLSRIVIDQYFKSPYYWHIDGCPYFSIYDLPRLVRGFGGIAETRAALDEFRAMVKQSGFPDLHLNLVHWQHVILGKETDLDWTPAAITALGFDSIASYVWIHHVEKFNFPETNYLDILDLNKKYWEQTAASFAIPYFPNVTMGWDSSPRARQSDPFVERSYPFMATLREATPKNFRQALVSAKLHVDNHRLPVKHISINAWNEWTEGSYLEPDTTHRLAYLQAIRDVFQS